MNTDYATKEGYVIFTGDVKRLYEISKWCKDRKLEYEVDYKYPYSEVVFQFKDPRQATIARLTWI